MVIEGVHGYHINVPDGAKVTITIELTAPSDRGSTLFTSEGWPNPNTVTIAERQTVHATPENYAFSTSHHEDGAVSMQWVPVTMTVDGAPENSSGSSPDLQEK